MKRHNIYKPLFFLFLFTSCGYNNPYALEKKIENGLGFVYFHNDSTSIQYERAFLVKNVFLDSSKFKIYDWEIDSVMPGHWEDELILDFETGSEEYLVFYRFYKFSRSDANDYNSSIFTIVLNVKNGDFNPKKSIITYPSGEWGHDYYVASEIVRDGKKIKYRGDISRYGGEFQITVDLNIDNNFNLKKFREAYGSFKKSK